MTITLNGTTGITTPASTVGGSAVLTTASTIAASALPAGSVLQVVQGKYSTQTSLTGTTTTATGLTATITPISATSKILITVFMPAFNASAAANASFYLYKNGGNLRQLAYYQGGSSTVATPYTAVYLDSPATTSATTYAIYATTAAGATMIWAFGNLDCNITLMEIAA
jgi:hypothetical protein